jgi:sugar/nucleoside kinase (ribokinase family)
LAEVIFIGLSTIDIVYGVDEFPHANSKVTARSQDVFVGGPATNAAITCAHLGGKATLVTAIGSHILAAAIKAEARQHSVNLIDLNPDFAELPVLSSIAVNNRGERNVVSANAARVSVPPARIDEAAFSKASFVMVDGHYMQACQTWASAAHARKVPVVLDGGSWKEGTADLLHFIDTAICSNDFMPPGCSSEDDVIKYLKDSGVANIAITKGADPITFQAKGAFGVIKVPSAEPVDTMGAGDIFHGAYCYFYSSGSGFVEALAEAAKIAAESCRFSGTREWMKHSIQERAFTS